MLTVYQRLKRIRVDCHSDRYSFCVQLRLYRGCYAAYIPKFRTTDRAHTNLAGTVAHQRQINTQILGIYRSRTARYNNLLTVKRAPVGCGQKTFGRSISGFAAPVVKQYNSQCHTKISGRKISFFNNRNISGFLSTQISVNISFYRFLRRNDCVQIINQRTVRG